MPVLVPDPLPAEVESLLARRRAIGADTHDEMWEGVLHMAPARQRRHADLEAQLIEQLGPLARAVGLRTLGAFNVGEPDNYRIPDIGLARPSDEDELYLATAELVVEILSPHDETWAKLPFYAAHHVDELLIVDPETHKVDWLALSDDGAGYKPAQRSALIELGPAQLAALIDWPATGG